MDRGLNPMKRLIGATLLAAFLSGVATPCQAAFMRCGMEKPSSEKRCGSCDPAGPSVPDLRAGSCCNVEPGRERDTAPALGSSGAAPGLSAPEKGAIAPVPDIAGLGPAASWSRPLGAPDATGPPHPPLHTTVLRL